MRPLLVTGTDTEVGKTVLTASLAAYWQKYCFDSSLGLLKLLQTGVGDRELYHQLFSTSRGITIGNSLCFETPVAPPIAANKEGKTINLGEIWQELCRLTQQQDFVLIEALGGLGSPITEQLTVADLAGDWRLDVVLVVPIKLGAIAQSVANVALARQNKLNLKGIVLNCTQPITDSEIGDLAPIDLIKSLTNIPVVGVIPHLQDLNQLDSLAQVAANLDLEVLLPNLTARKSER